jgi:hypothetical protein
MKLTLLAIRDTFLVFLIAAAIVAVPFALYATFSYQTNSTDLFVCPKDSIQVHGSQVSCNVEKR